MVHKHTTKLMHRFAATVRSKQILAGRTFVLELAGCRALSGVRPGQFVMLRGDWGRDPLLPRAFSVMSLRDEVAELLVKAVGRGTTLMEAAQPGARFQVLGPLGSWLPDPDSERMDWLVAGGVGLAPLLYYAERMALAGLGRKARLFYGGRSADDLVLLPRLQGSGIALDVATDDGTRGFAGRVTEAVAAALEGADGPRPTLMACGPQPMLVALAKLARSRGLRTYLCLEGEMACGIGVCLGCAVPGRRRFRYVCKDGPVMNLDDLAGPYA